MVSSLVHQGHRVAIVSGRTLIDAADEPELVVPASCRRSGRCHERIVEVTACGDALTPQRFEAIEDPSQLTLVTQSGRLVVDARDRSADKSTSELRAGGLMGAMAEPADRIAASGDRSCLGGPLTPNQAIGGRAYGSATIDAARPLGSARTTVVDAVAGLAGRQPGVRRRSGRAVPGFGTFGLVGVVFELLFFLARLQSHSSTPRCDAHSSGLRRKRSSSAVLRM
jgi:ferredoxin